VQDCPPVLDVAIETLEPDELAALQELRLRQQWSYVRECSEFYAGRLPEDISLDWLQDVGFTDKEELRASQDAAPRTPRRSCACTARAACPAAA
jgi:phenylacetate-CoA ligase